jgi:hypothetical protein
VLAVAVDNQNELARGVPDTGFDGGAITLVVGVPDDTGTSGGGRCSGSVRRAIVHDEHFAPGGNSTQTFHHHTHRTRFFERGYDDAHTRWISHGARNRIMV